MTLRIAIAPGVVGMSDAEGLVIMQRGTGRMFYGNMVGAVIWRGLASGVPVEGLVEEFVRRYGLASERASADLRTFIAALAEQRLIVVEGQS